jgi:hypothetical protein
MSFCIPSLYDFFALSTNEDGGEGGKAGEEGCCRVCEEEEGGDDGEVSLPKYSSISAFVNPAASALARVSF